MIKIIIETTEILITYMDKNELIIANLFGPLYTRFSINVHEQSIKTNYQKRLIVDNVINYKYSKKYNNIVNIFYDNFKITIDG
jgi:hypothetical protein